MNNPVQTAMRNIRLLSKSDVEIARATMRSALDSLKLGHEPHFNWCSLADSANMAESLCSMGIGAGEQAEKVISDAQQALADLYIRAKDRRTWAMRSVEIDALEWLVSLHMTQLENCSYGEFERAYRRTAERLTQARAGNAPRGARVLVGQVGLH